MKKQILLAIAIIAFLNVWTTTNVSAQSAKAVKINVAFDFKAKGKNFSAGEYYIESVSSTSDNVLSIKSAGEGKSQLIIAGHLYSGKIQSAKLVFERRGENNFLTGIFLESGNWGFSLPTPRGRNEKHRASYQTEIIVLPLLK
jgi:hypothetical protein